MRNEDETSILLQRRLRTRRDREEEDEYSYYDDELERDDSIMYAEGENMYVDDLEDEQQLTAYDLLQLARASNPYAASTDPWRILRQWSTSLSITCIHNKTESNLDFFLVLRLGPKDRTRQLTGSLKETTVYTERFSVKSGEYHQLRTPSM